MNMSVHAIEGAYSNRTIPLTGKRGNKEFSILVDGGSTHSFLDEKTALKLNHLLSKHECSNFARKVGDQNFSNQY